MYKHSFELQELWNAAKPSVIPGLIGAGLGAGAGGLTDHFTNKETDPAEKFKRTKRNILMGSALGGLGGIGFGQLPHFFPPTQGIGHGGPVPEAVQATYTGAREVTKHPALAAFGVGVGRPTMDWLRDTRPFNKGKGSVEDLIQGTLPKSLTDGKFDKFNPDTAQSLHDTVIAPLAQRSGSGVRRFIGGEKFNMTPSALGTTKDTLYASPEEISAKAKALMQDRPAAPGAVQGSPIVGPDGQPIAGGRGPNIPGMSHDDAMREANRLLAETQKKALGQYGEKGINSGKLTGFSGRLMDKFFSGAQGEGALKKFLKNVTGQNPHAPSWNQTIHGSGPSLSDYVKSNGGMREDLPMARPSMRNLGMARSFLPAALTYGAASAANRYIAPTTDRAIYGAPLDQYRESMDR